MRIMRTTLAIDDELLAAAKRRARARGVTLGAVVEAALRRDLLTTADAPDAPALPVFRGGSGPRAGLDLTSNRALRQALDAELEFDQLR
jgi:hypothetical protein